jgi:hypothetical protein
MTEPGDPDVVGAAASELVLTGDPERTRLS